MMFVGYGAKKQLSLRRLQEGAVALHFEAGTSLTTRFAYYVGHPMRLGALMQMGLSSVLRPAAQYASIQCVHFFFQSVKNVDMGN